MHNAEGKSEVIVLAKAAFQVNQGWEDAVYCTGVTPKGEWIRLSPLLFSSIADFQKLEQWNRIECEWRATTADTRHESRRVYGGPIRIIGEVSAAERYDLVSGLEVTELESLAGKGNTLALLRPRNLRFLFERKSPKDVIEERQTIELVTRQRELLGSDIHMPLPGFCPYKFKYKYTTDTGEHESVCRDLEINTTFLSWSKKYGEEQALSRMKKVFGDEYSRKTMAFIMGSSPSAGWSIASTLGMDQIYSMAGNRFDVVV